MEDERDTDGDAGAQPRKKYEALAHVQGFTGLLQHAQQFLATTSARPAR